MHPFEKANLGKAPFRFVGHEYRVGPMPMGDGMTTIGSPGQPMGTCQYCGNGIANCMMIRSSDGKTFMVGSDCVEKLYRPDNQTTTEQERAIARDPVYQAIRKAKLRYERERRHAREAVRLEAARKWADDNRAALESTRTPTASRPDQTLWDTVEWYWRNAGTTGKLRITKELQKRLDTCSTTT